MFQSSKEQWIKCLAQYDFFYFNFNLTPIDMYNGLSQDYCIKPDGRIH